MRMLSTLLDLLFPPRDTEKIVRNATIDASYLYTKPGFYKNTQFLTDYQNTLVRALVSENKYYQNCKATKILGAVLQKWVEEQDKPVVFIPIPLSKKRQKERGYNQVTEILKKVQSKNVSTIDILYRAKHTTPQTELNKTERLHNMKGVFAVKKNVSEITPVSLIVIIDDVVTTGATISEARATLAPHLPPNTTLITLALAH